MGRERKARENQESGRSRIERNCEFLLIKKQGLRSCDLGGREIGMTSEKGAWREIGNGAM